MLVTVGVSGVGVALAVGVTVTVGVSVGATACAVGCWRMAKYTNTAPIAKNRMNKPSAVGRLSVTAGRRLPWSFFVDLEGLSGLLRSVPHTRQRAASWLNLVPHVGHILVGLDGISGLIIICQAQ